MPLWPFWGPQKAGNLIAMPIFKILVWYCAYITVGAFLYGHSKPARNSASQSNISDNNADHCMQISGGGIVCADGQFAEECLDTAAQTGMEGKHEDDWTLKFWTLKIGNYWKPNWNGTITWFWLKTGNVCLILTLFDKIVVWSCKIKFILHNI